MQYFVFIAECETHERHIKVNDFTLFEVEPRLKMYEPDGSFYKRFIPYIIAGEQAVFYDGLKHSYSWDYSEQIFFLNDSRFYVVRVFEFSEYTGEVWHLDAEDATHFAREIYFHFI
jgi:hypothetical protein